MSEFWKVGHLYFWGNEGFRVVSKRPAETSKWYATPPGAVMIKFERLGSNPRMVDACYSDDPIDFEGTWPNVFDPNNPSHAAEVVVRLLRAANKEPTT